MQSKEDRGFQLKHFARRVQRLVEEASREADPVWLIQDGAPADEYSPEVGPIVSQLVRIGGKPSPEQVEQICRAVFQRYFGGVSMDDQAFVLMGHRIADEWDEIAPPD